MPLLIGEAVTFGVGPETVRGTAVAPSAWIPGRVPTNIKSVVDKTLIKETRGNGSMSQASEVVRSRAEGDIQFNVRTGFIGHILKSLFGSVGSVTALGATTHTFNLVGNLAQHPSLTLGLAQPGITDYRYPLSIVSQLEVNTPIDDLVNATASFVSSREETVADYTPAFTGLDNFFRNHDVTIKLAATVGGLAAATPICIKESSLSIVNNTRPNNCVGSVNPVDVISLLSEVTGSFTVDYDLATYRDMYANGTYQAMQIEFTRDDLAVIGTSALYHTVRFVFPKISLEDYAIDRPLDDLVTEQLSFTAHHDTVAGYMVRAILINDTASY